MRSMKEMEGADRFSVEICQLSIMFSFNDTRGRLDNIYLLILTRNFLTRNSGLSCFVVKVNRGQK